MPKNTKKVLIVPLVLALAAMLLTGCGGGRKASAGPVNISGTGGTDSAELGDPDISIVNFGYEDAEFTVAAGTEVVWVNDGSAPHTVTGDNFDSGVLRPGKGYAYTFTEPGTYEYWCTNHEGIMSGTITVE